MAGQDGLCDDDPIAIVGFSFTFPELATTEDAFWSMLVEGRCCATEFPSDRLNKSSFYSSKNGIDTIPVQKGHFLEQDLAAFDAPFFSMSSAEAAGLDPQQRLLLEVTYHALENGGIPLRKTAGSRTSVHVGSFSSDYTALQVRDPLFTSPFATMGSSASFLANRLSWYFDWNGPSVSVDTACSSSITALDLGCAALKDSDCDMGVVAGSAVLCDPYTWISLANIGALSPDGRSYSFDARANGYGRGEGVAAIIIKRLSDALSDGDPIRGIIRACASSSDGRTPIISQPSSTSQEALIDMVYKRAGLDKNDTSYFEAHATGTPLGDPMEVNAVSAAFEKNRSPDHPLYMGSVKSNVGHLEGASGLASVIKTILMQERGLIAPIADFQNLNPDITANLENLQFPSRCTPWPPGLRRASINSFGLGGSNSHLILDDASHFIPLSHSQSESPAADSISSELLTFSAPNSQALERLVDSYSEHFSNLNFEPKSETEFLRDLSYTLNERRSLLSSRCFAVVDSVHQLSKLRNITSRPIKSSSSINVAFIFTGQGATWTEIGRELLTYPAFRGSLEKSKDQIMSHTVDFPAIDNLLRGEVPSNLSNPEVGQPATTALQMAYVDLLRSFGVKPSAVIGHSSGEIAAAYCSGAITQQAAIQIAYYRGRLATALAKRTEHPGAMLAVGLSESEVSSTIEKVLSEMQLKQVSIACINSPQNVTLSGDAKIIDALKQEFSRQNVFARKLATDVAYHSSYMLEIADEYKASLADLKHDLVHTDDEVMMFSSLYGKFVMEPVVQQTEYWIQNLTSPVRFSQALESLLTHAAKPPTSEITNGTIHKVQIDYILEIGPSPALKRPVNETLRETGLSSKVPYDSILKSGSNGMSALLEACGRLYCSGFSFNLSELRPKANTLQSPSKVLTDLPKYPFDHSQLYWHEGSQSKSYRFRKSPHMPLLGSMVWGCNPLEPQWRNVINSNDIPWIKDHSINGVVLVPGGGMLAMVIEATKQLIDETRVLSAIQIQDCFFHNSITVDESNTDQETRVSLRPAFRGTSNQTPSSYDFSISSCHNSSWSENCSGRINLEFESSQNNAVSASHGKIGHSVAREKHNVSTNDTNQYMDSEAMYESWISSGFEFGQSFKLLSNVCSNDENAAEADIGPQNVEIASGAEATLATRLDSLIQLSLVAFTWAVKKQISTIVPTQIRKLWLSLATESTSQNLHGESWTYLNNTKSDSVVTSCSDGNLCATVEGLQFTTIERPAETTTEGTRTSPLCYEERLRPDVNILDQGQLFNYCFPRIPNEPPTELANEMQHVTLLASMRTMSTIDREALPSSQPHLKKYWDWMQSHVSKYHDAKLRYVDPSWNMSLDDANFYNVLNRIRDRGVIGNFYSQIVENLPTLLQGKTDALNVLFNGDLAKDSYYEMCRRANYRHAIGQYLTLLIHKNPNMKVAELGAGTGGLTRVLFETLLETMPEHSMPYFAQYDYTDISYSFFPGAEEMLKDLAKENFRFTPFDVEKDPDSQGMESGSYDLVLAGAVLHATSDIVATMRNVRKLLKPGGRMILIEPSSVDKETGTFIYGLLEGWWLSQDERVNNNHPLLSEPQWSEVLSRSGFRGNDLVVRDYEDPWCYEGSMIASTAVDQADLRSSCVANGQQMTTVAILSRTNEQYILGQKLADLVQQRHLASPRMYTLEEASTLDFSEHDNTTWISLLEIGTPLLFDIDSMTFKKLQKVMTSAKTFCWITCPKGLNEDSPSFSMIDGIVRVARSENEEVNLFTLTLKPREHLEVDDIKMIASFIQSKVKDVEGREYERETVEKNDLLQIPRIIPSEVNESHVQALSHTHETKLANVSPDLPIELEVEVPGIMSSMRFVEDETRNEPLAPNEIELEIKSVGLNFLDVLTVLGRMPQNYKVGFEAAGIVTRMGDSCHDSGIQVGDRVAALCPRAFRTLARCIYLYAAKIPNSLSFEQGAALPICFGTALYSLKNVAHLDSGESVLIHAAAGATGQAAIQVAQYLGAEIYTTVGSNEKKKLIMSQYSIPEDHIFYSRDSSFEKDIMNQTRGQGVDVVLNCLSGTLLEASWACVAPYGRFVEIGKSDIFGNSKLSMRQFEKNVSFSAFDLKGLSEDRPMIFQKLLKSVVELVDTKKVNPSLSLTSYPLSQLEESLRLLQAGKSTGKMVVRFEEHDQIQVRLPMRPSWNFDSTGTYIVVGGFKGVCRAIVEWMADRGARHLVLLSRSGPPSDEETQTFLQSLREKDINVLALACDICSDSAVRSVVSQCEATFPPIKGCVQGSGVLKDAPFSNMEFDQWQAAIAPKIIGTWNLHKRLPRNLDFFVMLASITGTFGNEGQANYAAGNTYQDALAHYRTSVLGENATSIDLSLINDTARSALVSDEAANKIIRAKKVVPMSTQEVCAILDRYCGPDHRITNSANGPSGEEEFDCQVICGIQTPANRQAAGMEPLSFMHEPAWRYLWKLSNSANKALKGEGTETDYGGEFRSLLSQSPPSIDAARDVATSALVHKIARSQALDDEDIDVDKPLHAYGMDSLVALEIRNWLRRTFEVNDENLTVTDILSGKTFSEVGDLLVERSSIPKQVDKGEDESKSTNENDGNLD